MEKNLNLKQDFTVSLKPNRLFFKVIGDVSGPTCPIYYELIYDHYEDVLVETISPITEIQTETTGSTEIQTETTGSTETPVEPVYRKEFKYSITLFKGNETLPTQYLIPVLSGDKPTTNMILQGFTWHGPFSGLIMEI